MALKPRPKAHRVLGAGRPQGPKPEGVTASDRCDVDRCAGSGPTGAGRNLSRQNTPCHTACDTGGWSDWCQTPVGPFEGDALIVLGLILLVVGWLLAIHLLHILGLILVVTGVVLELLPLTGHSIGNRRHYW